MKSRELTAPGPEARRGEDIVRREPALLARARRQLDRFPRERRDRQLGPLGLVAIAVGFNLWVLRAEILPVLNLNDSAVHLSMVRWALDRMQEGHLPFDGWYPYLVSSHLCRNVGLAGGCVNRLPLLEARAQTAA